MVQHWEPMAPSQKLGLTTEISLGATEHNTLSPLTLHSWCESASFLNTLNKK